MHAFFSPGSGQFPDGDQRIASYLSLEEEDINEQISINSRMQEDIRAGRYDKELFDLINNKVGSAPEKYMRILSKVLLLERIRNSENLLKAVLDSKNIFLEVKLMLLFAIYPDKLEEYLRDVPKENIETISELILPVALKNDEEFRKVANWLKSKLDSWGVSKIITEHERRLNRQSSSMNRRDHKHGPREVASAPPKISMSATSKQSALPLANLNELSGDELSGLAYANPQFAKWLRGEPKFLNKLASHHLAAIIQKYPWFLWQIQPQLHTFAYFSIGLAIKRAVLNRLTDVGNWLGIIAPYPHIITPLPLLDKFNQKELRQIVTNSSVLAKECVPLLINDQKFLNRFVEAGCIEKIACAEGREEFTMWLVGHRPELLDTFNGDTLYRMACEFQKFAEYLSQQQTLLNKIIISDLYKSHRICKIVLAQPVFADWFIKCRPDSQDILLYHIFKYEPELEEYPKFIMWVITKQPELLKRLDVGSLQRIIYLSPAKLFPLAKLVSLLINDLELQNRFVETKVLGAIVVRSLEFAKYLSQQPALLSKLDEETVCMIARKRPKLFANWLIVKRPELLNTLLDGDNNHFYGRKFVMWLIENQPELLNKLDQDKLKESVKKHLKVAMWLTEPAQENFFNTFNSEDITNIAYRHPQFLYTVLSNERLAAKLSPEVKEKWQFIQAQIEKFTVLSNPLAPSFPSPR